MEEPSGEERAGGSATRRGFLGGALTVAALAAGQWTPVFRIPAASAAATIPPPPNPPSGISFYQQAYQNWSGEIQVDGLWTCAPTSAADVVTLANWARASKWRVRAAGKRHGFSPLTVASKTPSNVVIADTTQHLTAVTVNSGSPASVTAQTGVTMDTLLSTLEQAGYGFAHVPAPGDLSIGGVLAINAHGAFAGKTGGATPESGQTYGSLSNTIVSLTAVVWDSSGGQYKLKTFSRSDPAIGPLLVSLGRSFITEVTLRVGANQRMRCQSYATIPTSTLFASPSQADSNSFASFLQSGGGVEALWFPYTQNPWLKVWSVEPIKPLPSKEVNAPYNYPGTIPQQAADLLSQIVSGNVSVTPEFCNLMYTAATGGLVLTGTADIWGWSKNVLLYAPSETLKVTVNGYAVLTSRSQVQRVASEFFNFTQSRLQTYASQGKYPANGPVEIRCTGLDRTADVQVPGAVQPTLSSVRPRPDHPEWDTVVWLVNTIIPGTPDSEQFYRDIEQFVFSTYNGSYAFARVEWAKGWAFNGTTAWSDPTVLGTTIPGTFRAGLPSGSNWDSALVALDGYDPHRVFSNSFLDKLLP
jgi:FAD/FMN-containing dehydrogenase